MPYLVCGTATESTLLSGRLNIHFGGRFVGGSPLTEKRAGEDLMANLGVERNVKVLREKITDKRTETFFGVVDRQSVARELEYRNYQPRSNIPNFRSGPRINRRFASTSLSGKT